MDEAVAVLTLVDTFIEGIMESVDMSRTSVIITSDHGNLEDLSIKSHTRNPVPFIAIGRRHSSLASSVNDLTDVVPALIDILN